MRQNFEPDRIQNFIATHGNDQLCPYIKYITENLIVSSLKWMLGIVSGGIIVLAGATGIPGRHRLKLFSGQAI